MPAWVKDIHLSVLLWAQEYSDLSGNFDACFGNRYPLIASKFQCSP
ncbi:MAG: hypothetical protein RLZZ303_1559 [Candidatus Hydrogenedentota bacterium]|jgi:hypothetical protein